MPTSTMTNKSRIPTGRCRSASAMEYAQKKVLRRKAFVLAQTVTECPEFAGNLCKQGVLQQDDLKLLGECQEWEDRAQRLIETLEDGGDTHFNKLCFTLETVGRGWVADELEAELRAERGDLHPQRYVREECRLVSHRAIDDLDDRVRAQVIDALAMRYQVAKEAWQRQVRKKKAELGKERDVMQQEVVNLFRQIEAVIQRKRDLLTGLGGDVQLQLTMKQDRLTADNAAVMLQGRVTMLLHILDTMLKQHAAIQQERERCFTLLGAKPSSKKTLHALLEEMLHKTTADLQATRTDTDARHAQTDSLNAQLLALRQELDKQEKLRRFEQDKLERESAMKDDVIARLRAALEKAQHDAQVAEAQLDHWKKKVAVIDKTRKLGFHANEKLQAPQAPATNGTVTATMNPNIFLGFRKPGSGDSNSTDENSR